jgi:signal peptidase I
MTDNALGNLLVDQSVVLDQPGRLSRFFSHLLWWVVPGLVLVMVLGYIGDAVISHAFPPVVPVTGVSMRPTLQAGDLVFLNGVNPKTLHKGDIVAVNVPKADQTQYGLPSHVVHRIVEIQHGSQGLIFVTKGDANSGRDVFSTPARDVIGKMEGHLPGLGYPFLFIRSRQGEIFLVAAALLAMLYFALGLFEDRRIVVEGSAITMQMLLQETHDLREAIALTEPLRETQLKTPRAIEIGPDDFEVVDFRRKSEQSRGTNDDAIDRITHAISEYGTHLLSHTAVMQNLAATTGELQLATTELRAAVVVERLPHVDTNIAVTTHLTGSENGPVNFEPLRRLGPSLARQRMALTARSNAVDDILRRIDATFNNVTTYEVEER